MEPPLCVIGLPFSSFCGLLRSLARVAHILGGLGGLSHERVHGGKDWGSKWECWAHNTSLTMLQPDHKLRGFPCRSLEKAKSGTVAVHRYPH